VSASLKLHKATVEAPPSDPLDREGLIGRAEFQKLLGIGQSTFERLKARGRLLPAIELSATLHRWRLADVLDWIRDGCRNPAEWLKGR
jgi:predicted DNA-binding transcriptional regulator AlpA